MTDTIPILGPPIFWVALLQSLDVPESVGRRLWRALIGSTDPLTRAFVYSISRGDRVKDRDAMLRVWLSGNGTPQCLVDAIEGLVGEGKITRTDAAAFEDKLLSYVNSTGRWI